MGCSIYSDSDDFDTIVYPLPPFLSIFSPGPFILNLYIETSAHSYPKILIYIDSLSTLTTLKNCPRKEQHPYANQIVSLFSKGYNETLLAWVPGHRGITEIKSGNSAAKKQLNTSLTLTFLFHRQTFVLQRNLFYRTNGP